MNRTQLRLAAFGAFLLIFPLFLRRRPRVVRHVTICAPPSAIFPYLNDLRNWPLWTVWGRRDHVHYSYGDKAEGTGALQRWRGGRMSGELRLYRSDLDSRVDYELVLNGGRSHLFGRIELVEDGACTRVTWRCVWARSRNPYRRYLDLLIKAMVTRDFGSSLSRLRQLVESSSQAVLTPV